MLRCVKDQSVNASYLIMQRSPLLCSSAINSSKSSPSVTMLYNDPLKQLHDQILILSNALISD